MTRRAFNRDLSLSLIGLVASPLLSKFSYSEDLDQAYVSKVMKIYDYVKANGKPGGNSTELIVPLKDIDADNNPDRVEVRIYSAHSSFQLEVYPSGRTEPGVPGISGTINNNGSLNSKLIIRSTTNKDMANYIDAACDALNIK